MLYTTASKIKKSEIELLPRRLPTRAALFCDSTYFEVVDVKNFYMPGNEGLVNKKAATQQWNLFTRTIQERGMPGEFIVSRPGLEDMIFTANCGNCWMRDGDLAPTFLVSSMKHERRRPESQYYEAWFKSKGYRVEYITTPGVFFEGCGDALWHPGKMLLWGGYGKRTSPESYEEISRRFGIPIIMLELVRDEFYHLDTCFSLLDHNTVMYCPDAFSEEGRMIIERTFPRRIVVEFDEAKNFLVCNACVIQNRHVIMPQGNGLLARRLVENNFFPIELDMSEFKKSGGGPACLWLEIY